MAIDFVARGQDLELKGIRKEFPGFVAVDNLDLHIPAGEFFALLGPSGCGKSTFMKILSGELTPSSGNVSITPGLKVGTLSQDQFAFEQYTVIDTVIMGDVALWKVKQERDRIFAKPDMTEADGMRVGDLESEFAEMDGYTATREIRTGKYTENFGIPIIAMTASALIGENQKCFVSIRK